MSTITSLFPETVGTAQRQMQEPQWRSFIQPIVEGKRELRWGQSAECSSPDEAVAYAVFHKGKMIDRLVVGDVRYPKDMDGRRGYERTNGVRIVWVLTPANFRHPTSGIAPEVNYNLYGARNYNGEDAEALVLIENIDADETGDRNPRRLQWYNFKNEYPHKTKPSGAVVPETLFDIDSDQNEDQELTKVFARIIGELNQLSTTERAWAMSAIQTYPFDR
jgi:hypothetical protein